MSTQQKTKVWDYLIIGSGMGGCIAAQRLVQAGFSVLMCEKGRSSLPGAPALRGEAAEIFLAQDRGRDPAEVLAKAGRVSSLITDRTQGKAEKIRPFTGSGTGGSAALYGAVLERYLPSDLQPKGKGTQSWPISFSELEPYYQQIEGLFRVRGEADPLRPEQSFNLSKATPRSEAQEDLTKHLKSRGLHPYRLPVAVDPQPGCDGCQGHLCDHHGKNDPIKICLEPLLSNPNFKLLHDCEITRLDATRSQVTSADALHLGRKIQLKARKFILASGALGSAGLLLKSTSALWPKGLANDSDLVGRGLMRHYIDLFVITPKVPVKGSEATRKEIGLSDFRIGADLGILQSFGALRTEVVLEDLIQKLALNQGPMTRAAFQAAKPLVRQAIARMLEGKLILASILEDSAEETNRVRVGADGKLEIEYRIPARDRERIRRFRRLVKEALKPYRVQMIARADKNDMLAHACGTCRAGVDPAKSVVDPSGRAHGLANLYVVDGSYFPTSGCANPALTIAANSLRIAEKLIALERENRKSGSKSREQSLEGQL
ncbi:MAG: GMC family oxidoreductase [Oligoflexia bacterium]|nr:GMC family oxidoreductase [Oligoflexia bacterium]